MIRTLLLTMVVATWSATSPAKVEGQSPVVDVTLDLLYSDPSDSNSAGTWQLVAKSSDRGLAGLDLALTGVNPNPTFEAP